MPTHVAEHPSPGLMRLVGHDQMLICLLGSVRLLYQGQPLTIPVAGKALTLMSTLALHLETGVSRDALLETLWPEQGSDQSANSLHSLIYSLQRRLSRGGFEPAAVVYANGSYTLNREAGVSTDVARFDALVAEGNRLASLQHHAEANGRYEQAVTLYRGDLTVDKDVFAVIERERLRASFLTMLARLAERAYGEADYTAAAAHASRMLAYDPCREDAHRVVMRAHMRRGERAQALRQYRHCQDILQREFETAPEAATAELFELIRGNPEAF